MNIRKRPRTARQRRLSTSQQRQIKEEIELIKTNMKNLSMGKTGSVLFMGCGAWGSVHFWPNARDNYFVPHNQWRQTQGVLISVDKYQYSSRKTRYYNSDSYSYRVYPKYSYSVDGQKYTGDRLRFGGDFSNSQEADATYKKLKSSSSVNVYYNVKRPESSTLSINNYRDSLAFFLFAFVAIFGLALGVFAMKESARLKKQLAEYHKSAGSHSG